MTEEKEIGEVKIDDTRSIKVRVSEWRGVMRVDVRQFLNTANYKGPTKKGISIPLANYPAVLEILNKVPK